MQGGGTFAVSQKGRTSLSPPTPSHRVSSVTGRVGGGTSSRPRKARARAGPATRFKTQQGALAVLPYWKPPPEDSIVMMSLDSQLPGGPTGIWDGGCDEIDHPGLSRERVGPPLGHSAYTARRSWEPATGPTVHRLDLLAPRDDELHGRASHSKGLAPVQPRRPCRRVARVTAQPWAK